MIGGTSLNILITGKNSYIGNNLYDWLNKSEIQFNINRISLKDNQWKSLEFSQFDSIVHVAGIAHVSADPNMEESYYRVNRDLTYEVAKKAKREGVSQFIFLSSIIVYGDANENTKHINEKTKPKPSNFYGGSKLEAEQLIEKLNDQDFKVVIIRPPMAYGKKSKGNYPKLSKAARLIPFFPDFENKRSMIHIDNLTELMKLIIVNKESGLFFPQNTEYVKTSELFRLIRKAHGKKTYFTTLFNPILGILIKKVTIVNKLFGNLTYDLSLSEYKDNYRVHTLEESIIETEI